MKKKSFRLPQTPFNRLLLAWGVFTLANVALSQSIAVSLLSLFNFLPLQSLNTPLNSLNPALPLGESWQVALGSIGVSIKNALFGVGLGNFANSFTAFHSASFNSNPLWFFRFNHSVSPALTVLIEQGLFGVFFWLFLFYKSYQSYQSYLSHDQEFFYSTKKRFLIKICFGLIAFCFVFFLFDFSTLIFRVFGFSGFEISNLISLIPFASLISLGLLLSKKPDIKKRWLPLTLPLILPLIALIFLSSHINPSLQMQLAQNSLAAAEKTKSKTQIKNLSISALSQSARAISLDPQNSSLHLAHLKTLISLNSLIADSDRLISDEFMTLLRLAPTDPQVFLALGRYQFSQGDFFGASQSFKTAINLKSDFSPAWYDIAQTYERLAQNARSIGNKDLETQNKKLSVIALKETKRLVCEVNYSKKDCEKITNLKP